MRAVWKAAGSSLAVAALAAGLAGCGDKKDAAKAPPPPPEVQVVEARSETVPVRREYVGNVTAYRSVQVRARVEGILEKRHFTEGTDVKPGQLLYTIDPLTLRGAAARRRSRARARRGAPRQRADEGGALRAAGQGRGDQPAGLRRRRHAAEERRRRRSESARATLGSREAQPRLHEGLRHRVRPHRHVAGARRRAGRQGRADAARDDRQARSDLRDLHDRRTATRSRCAARSTAARSRRRRREHGALPPARRHRLQAGRAHRLRDTQVNRDTGTITLRAVLPNASPRLLPGMFVRVAADRAASARTRCWCRSRRW